MAVTAGLGSGPAVSAHASNRLCAAGLGHAVGARVRFSISETGLAYVHAHGAGTVAPHTLRLEVDRRRS